MHISFTAHKADSSTSSSNLVEYLDKENQLNNINSEQKDYENFFDGAYNSVNPFQEIETGTIINELDNNRGSQKLTSSNFYMLNISPSKFELDHMEKLAEKELKNRGIDENLNEASKVFYKEQKEELMKMQMKLYTKDVMNEYAINFNREIYINEDKLPNDAEKKELNLNTEKEFNKFLKEKNIELKSNNESIPNDSKEWITTNNISIKEEKGKSLLVEIDLKDKGKSNVFIPKSTLQLQKDGSYKLPKNLYEQKEKEVISKNTFVEIDYKFKDSYEPLKSSKDKIFNFEKKDDRFKEPLSFSINEKDVQIKDGKYFVSEHLINEKKNYAVGKGVEKEYSNEKEKIYNSLAKEKGFDLSKRPMTGDDLLWYGKIEKSRTYKHTDKWVKENKAILKEIDKLKINPKPNKKEIEKLENSLKKEKVSGKIVVAGLPKEGLQFHSHVIVSRHDKTMKNARNKISLSPLANAKESNMLNGAKVGFNRDNFFQKAETVFDKKFEYDRPKEKSYEVYKNEKHQNSKIESKAKSETKQFLMKHTGLNHIKQNISPVQNIKKEMGIANIPTKLPTSVVELAYKVTKKVISKGFEY